jgi:hypothetical protein
MRVGPQAHRQQRRHQYEPATDGEVGPTPAGRVGLRRRLGLGALGQPGVDDPRRPVGTDEAHDADRGVLGVTIGVAFGALTRWRHRDLGIVVRPAIVGRRSAPHLGDDTADQSVEACR